MRCREAKQWISNLGARGSDLPSVVQDHVEECHSCAIRLKVFRIERAIFRALKPEPFEPDSFFASRILARLRSKTFATDRERLLSVWRAALQIAPAALAVVIVALAAMLVLAPREVPEPILDSYLKASRLTPTERLMLAEERLDNDRVLESIIREGKKNGE